MPQQQIRSNTAHKRPVATNLADGQLSVNYHADSPGVYAKDSNNTLFKIGPIHVGPTAPNVSPAGSAGNSTGEGWLDNSGANAVLKVWNGTGWSTVSPIASGTVVSTADTGTVTSTMIADGTITNTDINASAAIALSKLATGALPAAITVASTNIVDGTVVNGDISASAAIAHSKLANITAGQVLLGNASNVPTATALSGDVTVTSTGVTAIKSNVALAGTPTAPTAEAGTNTTQIATTAFVTSAVDTARQGLTYKQGCRVATTADITLSGTQTIDDVALIAGDRVLVKNQTNASLNGIYEVAAGAWSRAADFDASADITDGAFVFVTEGTTQGDCGWVLSTDGAITVGTTALTFVQFSGAGTFSAGNGLQLSGTQLSLAALPSANLLIGNGSNVATATAVTGDVTISNAGVTTIGAAKVTNEMLAGSIADSNLSTISTAGKVANTATTATDANTPSAIVARDASGNFSAGTITATLSGNATTATNLSSSRTFDLTGDITGSVSSDLGTGVSIVTSIGTGVITNADISASAAIADTKLATISTAGKVSNSATTATSLNTSNTIVARTNAGNIDISSINASHIGGFHNVIINGNFDIWARGTTFTGSGVYFCADRWIVNGNSTSVSRQTVSAFDPQNAESQYFLRATWNNNLSTSAYIAQRIESVRTFAGREVTLSFRAKTTNTPLYALSVSVVQYNGSSIGSVTTVGTTGNMALTWNTFKVTFTMPAIPDGLVEGTDYTEIRINVPSNLACSLDISQVQLERGPSATAFEQRSITVEQLLCYRYYFRLNDATEINTFLGIGSGGSQYAGAVMTVGFGNATLPARMRAIPAVFFSATSYINCTSLTLQPYSTHIRSNTPALGVGITNVSAAAPFILDAELV